MSGSVVSFEATPPSAGEMAARIRAAHAWLVAEEGGEVLAYAYGGTHRTRAAYRWTAEVSAYVAPSAQRSGVGRSLYGALLERLRERGFRLLVAGITLPNDASVGFHEAMGFYPVGIFKSIGYKAERWWDVGWWQLDLGAPGDPPREPGSPH